VDVFDAVRTVLAVRRYRDRPVPEDVIERIVESARLTASAANGQPWHFIVVRNPETLRELGKAVRSGPYIGGAAFAVAVAVERTRLAESDASRAIQSMILTAWDAGIGSNWTGFGGLDRVASLLGVPDEYEVLAVVPFGYPDEDRRRGLKSRKPRDQVVSAERFGEPFDAAGQA
jgi:nitroreductase